MRKLSLVGLAFATLGAVALSAGPSAAMGCLNPYAGAVSLTHNDMNPGAGFGYDKNFVNQQLAKGNRCDQVEQSYSAYDQYNRRPKEGRNKSNGNYY